MAFMQLIEKLFTKSSTTKGLYLTASILAIAGLAIGYFKKLRNEKKKSKARCENRNKLGKLLEIFNNHDKVLQWKENVRKSNKGWGVETVPGLLDSTRSLVEDIFKCLGLKLVILEKEYFKKHINYDIKATPAHEGNVNKFLPNLVNEISIYSDSLFEKLGVDKIILCEESYVNDQYRQAIPDWGSGQLIYTCKEAVQYSIEVIHHELFHYIDYKRVGNNYIHDEEWEMLNNREFKYGTGGINNREWKPLDPSFVGFVSFYATTALEEDKAEIWAYNIRNHLKFMKHADEILKSKAMLLKKQLRGFDDFCFGEEFWDKLQCRVDIIKEAFDN